MTQSICCESWRYISLHNLIIKPTWITQWSESLLDVCITSSPEKMIHSDIFHVGLSCHLIYAVFEINNLPKCNRTREIEVGNLTVNFFSRLASSTLGVFVSLWRSRECNGELLEDYVLRSVDRHAPVRSKRVRNRTSFPFLGCLRISGIKCWSVTVLSA